MFLNCFGREHRCIGYTKLKLLIFIRRIDKPFCITEELLSMDSLKGTTTGQDIFDRVMHSLGKSQLCLDRLVSITTDSVHSLTGKLSGLGKRINDKIQADYPLHRVLTFHCIIYYDSLQIQVRFQTCCGSSSTSNKCN